MIKDKVMKQFIEGHQIGVLRTDLTLEEFDITLKKAKQRNKK